MPYSAYRSGFSSYLKLERGLSPNTVNAYLHDIDLLHRFLSEEKDCKSIKQTDLDDLTGFITFINKLKLSPYTQSRVISGIKAFFRYLLLEQLIDNDPSALIDAPRLGRKLPDVLNIDDVSRIIDGIDLSDPNGERNKAILETLYGCGLRVSELTNLKLSDLHFREGIIMVTGKGNKQRLVPIGNSARRQIERYLKEVRIHTEPLKGAEELVFLNRNGGKLTRQMIFLIVRQRVEASGIRKKVSPHTFRHSFATHLVQNGADLRAVQELLGHVSITTTEIYTHLDSDDLRKAVMKYHPRNTGG